MAKIFRFSADRKYFFALTVVMRVWIAPYPNALPRSEESSILVGPFRTRDERALWKKKCLECMSRDVRTRCLRVRLATLPLEQLSKFVSDINPRKPGGNAIDSAGLIDAMARAKRQRLISNGN